MTTADFLPRETLMPLVGGAAGGAIARVAADGDLPAPHAAQLDRTLIELLEIGLYQAGQQAKAAARLLSMSGRRILGRPHAALRIVNPGDVVGLGTENAASAELGLALALLLFEAQSEEPSVLASGTLGLTGVGSEVRVEPVHHLGRKLQLVIQHFSQPGSAKPPRWFLVPESDPDGTSIRDRYQREIGLLQNLNIELRSVATLAEAAAIIGATRRAVGRTERIAQWLLGISVCAIIAASAFWFWLLSPIALSVVPELNPDGTLVATPARIISGHNSATAPCQLDQSELPAFVVGDHLLFKIRTGTPNDPTSLIGGYHQLVIMIAINAQGETYIRLPPADKYIVPGSVTAYWPEVKGPDESMLIVLAKRGIPFDAQVWEAKLRDALQPLAPAEKFSAAYNFLKDAAPGVLIYKFQTVAKGRCL